MHSTCGNISNVYPLVDQSTLGCTIFAICAMCAFAATGATTRWYLGLTWLLPDHGCISCRIRSIHTVDTKLSLVMQWRYGWTNTKLEKDETCFGLRANRLPDRKLLPIRIGMSIVGNITLAEWQSSLTYYTRCSNLHIQRSAMTEWKTTSRSIIALSESILSKALTSAHRANSKR